MRGGRGGGGGRGPGRVSLYTAASVASKVGFGLLVFFAAVGVYETVPRMFGRGSIAASLVAPRDRFLARGPVAGSGNLRAGPAAGDPYGPVVDGVVGGGGGDGGGGGEDSSSTSSSSGSSSGGGGDDACPPNDPYCHHPGGAGEAKPSNNNVNVDGGEEVTPPSQPAAVAPPPSGPVANPDYVPVAVPRPDGWVPAQRPLADGSERAVTGHVYGGAVAASMNPPLAFAAVTSDPDELAELESRLVVAIGMGVHSGNANVDRDGLASLPLFNTLLPTFFPTAQPHHIYRFYFAFDHNDPIYESETWRAAIVKAFYALLATEDATRWHPPNYVAGTTIDASRLIATLHFVHCDYSSKPSWAHSDAIMAAYKEGADYAFRSNDDTRCPEATDWVDRFVLDLRSRAIPNLGVVGPGCDVGAQWILTHDFTHRTHAVVFGYEYPRSLPNWSSDDWVTYVYKQFDLMSRRDDTKVQHMLFGTRYTPQNRDTRLRALNKELAIGADAIRAFIKERNLPQPPFRAEVVTCC